jgi:hypothetical protein
VKQWLCPRESVVVGDEGEQGAIIAHTSFYIIMISLLGKEELT